MEKDTENIQNIFRCKLCRFTAPKKILVAAHMKIKHNNNSWKPVGNNFAIPNGQVLLARVQNFIERPCDTQIQIKREHDKEAGRLNYSETEKQEKVDAEKEQEKLDAERKQQKIKQKKIDSDISETDDTENSTVETRWNSPEDTLYSVVSVTKTVLVFRRHPLSERQHFPKKEVENKSPELPQEIPKNVVQKIKRELELSSEDLDESLRQNPRKKSRGDYWSCPHCNYVNSPYEKIVKHIRKHAVSRPFACSLCEYRYSRAYHLYDHIRKAHPEEENPFPCPACEETFPSVEDLLEHKKSTGHAHTISEESLPPQLSPQKWLKDSFPGKNLISCQYCSYRCQNRYGMEKHMRIHTGVKPFACRLCPYKASTSSCLYNHIRNWHQDEEKPYPCPACDEDFPSVKDLLDHKRDAGCDRRMTTINVSPQGTSRCADNSDGNSVSQSLQIQKVGNWRKYAEFDPIDRPYPCSFCPYRGPTPSVLRIHLRIHTGEKPYRCAFCPYAAAQLQLVKYHLRDKHNADELADDIVKVGK